MSGLVRVRAAKRGHYLVNDLFDGALYNLLDDSFDGYLLDHDL